MSDNQEQTMEEILASIRRIISEDDALPSAPFHAREEPLVLGEDDVLKAGPDPLDTGEALVMSALEPQPLQSAPPAPALASSEGGPAPPHSGADPQKTGEALVMNDLESARPAASVPADEPLISPPVARSVAAAFEALERSVQMPPTGRTLEDSVRDMLRPMLKTWLEDNLQTIVASQVAAEVERIARQRR